MKGSTLFSFYTTTNSAASSSMMQSSSSSTTSMNSIASTTLRIGSATTTTMSTPLPLLPLLDTTNNNEHANNLFDLDNHSPFHNVGPPPPSSSYRRKTTKKSSGPPIINPTDVQINLTSEEEDLFNLLRTVTIDRNMKTTLRVAGGWVRDKILSSNDFNVGMAYLNNKKKEELNDLFDNDDEREVGDEDAQTRIKQEQQQRNTKGAAKSKEEDLELTLQAIMKSTSTPHISSSSSSSSNNSNNINYHTPCFSVTEHVDIDITLDDCYGSEFASELNNWLTDHPNSAKHLGEYSVGCILSNPDQSQHLETATMRLNNYWIDFVNLRAEEYSNHPNNESRIPNVIRIGSPVEDAQRRDLTINSLFYNINTKKIEDYTGRGLVDLQLGMVDTPLTPLKTLLDDPLRVLRSIRFAARLRFNISNDLWNAASDPSVNIALGKKVSRERIGNEINLMLQSRDPARALELLINLGLINTVFPKPTKSRSKKKSEVDDEGEEYYKGVYREGFTLLSTTHDHLVDCMTNRPGWCEAKRALDAGAVNGLGKSETLPLMEDEEARRLLWYAAFLKPLRDRAIANNNEGGEDNDDNDRKKPRKAKQRSAILTLLVDELKRPTKEAQSIESIMKAADEFTDLVSMGGSESALAILLSGARVVVTKKQQLGLDAGEDRSMERRIECSMDNHRINPNTENDPVWVASMEFRQQCAKVLKKVGHLWRAAFILSLNEQLLDWQSHQIIDYDDESTTSSDDDLYICEGLEETPEEVICSILKRYDLFAAAMLQMGLIGIWKQHPMLDGSEIKGDSSILPNLPNGPEFRTIMNAQMQWMITHPGGSREALVEHLREEFPSYV